MTDVYQRLAAHLDRLPAGYPATESGVELRILRRLFTPEEAGIALGLGMFPEPPEAIAARLGAEPGALSPVLDQMSRKGLIFRSTRNGQSSYMAAQFVIGIWEYHVNDLTDELIRDFNEYVPHLMRHSWEKTETKQLRVIPVSKSIRADMTVMPYEAAEEIITGQSRIVVAPCICRKEHDMVGEGCGKPLESCLVFGTGATFYEENGLGRRITTDEAIAILHRGMEAGLVLQPGNSKQPLNICMCCGCCCQILKNLKTLPEPATAVSSNYLAVTDANACTGCGSCADACQMGAISVADTARIDPKRCIGCGLCVPACPVDAVSLTPKPEDQRRVPPRNVVETYINIAKERGLI